MCEFCEKNAPQPGDFLCAECDASQFLNQERKEDCPPVEKPPVTILVFLPKGDNE